MPFDKSKYPPNWDSEIRPRILARANNRCECCGLKNGEEVYSFKNEENKTVWERLVEGIWQTNPMPKKVKVVLTIAHLDHDEENWNVTDDRLKAMCQLHHLQYDAEEKKRRKSIKK